MSNIINLPTYSASLQFGDRFVLVNLSYVTEMEVVEKLSGILEVENTEEFCDIVLNKTVLNIFDNDGVEPLNVPMTLTVPQAIEYVSNMNEDGYEIFVELYSDTDYEEFKEIYQGCFLSKEYFAEELVENNGWYDALDKAGISRSYFDLDQFIVDLECGGDYTFYFYGDSYYVFSNF